MQKLISIAPVGRVAYSILEFIQRLDALAIPAMPIKGAETNSRGRETDRYYRLEVDGLVESPWVTVTENADSITATISGDSSVMIETPEEAFEALKNDCRSRLADAGIEPAF